MKDLDSYIKTARKAQKIDLPFSNQEFRKMAMASKLSNSASQNRITEKLMSNFGKTIMISTAAIILALIATITTGIFSNTDIEEKSIEKIASKEAIPTQVATTTNIDEQAPLTLKMKPQNSYSNNKVFATKTIEQSTEIEENKTINNTENPLPEQNIDESNYADIAVNNAEVIKDIPVIIAADFADAEPEQETAPNSTEKEELLEQIEVLKQLVEKNGEHSDEKYKKNRFGLSFGLNQALNFNTNLYAEEVADCNCSVYPYYSVGYSVGLVYEHIIGNPTKNRMSFLMKSNYSSLPTLNQNTAEDYPTKINEYDKNGELISTQYVFTGTEMRSKIDYTVASLEFLYRLRPFSFCNLGIVAGTTFDYTLYTYHKSSFDLTIPSSSTFADGSRSKIFDDGKIDDAEKIRVGIKAGIQYDIEIGRYFYITPAAFYNAGLTSLSRDRQWTINAIQASVDLKFAF